jgi:hypothetical protein
MVRRIGFNESSGDGAVSGRRSVLGRRRVEEAPSRAPGPAASASAGSRGVSRFFLLFALIPLIFVGVGGYMMVDAIRFSGIAEKTVGIVIDLDVDSDSDGTTYTPVFRFVDSRGSTHSGRTHIASSEYDYAIGAEEEILYDPGAPEDGVRINGIFSLWGLPAIFLGVGLIVFIVMVRVYATSRGGPAAS